MNTRKIKNLIKKALHGYRGSSDTYIDKLRKLGAQIGEGVTIYNPGITTIDLTAPFLLTIGDNVKMTGPITIMTHDYSWSVIKGLTGEILGNEKRVTIGSNVFIGWGATILCGTRIPDNTIIGAHAVVSGILDGNSVWGGVPAKRICSLEDFRAKRAAAQLSEAKDFVLAYRERYGENPPAEIVDEYFMLFASDDELNEKYLYQMSLMGTYDKTRDLLPETRQFDSYVDFLASF